MKAPTLQLRIAQDDYDRLHAHLFPGDGDEHGVVLKAGLVQEGAQVRLLVREVLPAREGIDYKPSRIAYRVLDAQFIHRHIVACRDERLVYLAVHNHESSTHVAFSSIDMESHERGYPALRDIANGMPVGALVFGTQSVAADIWMPDGSRLVLDEAVVVGSTLQRLYSRPPTMDRITAQNAGAESFDRQVRLFGRNGQGILARSRVAVIGLGGVGALVSEYLARLGVGRLVLVDPDRIEQTNASRVVGATSQDVATGTNKVEIARRVALSAMPAPEVEVIAGDVATDYVARALRTCDYVFLAADSMRARLVFNALVHQYLIPGVQLGAKVDTPRGESLRAWSAIRPVRPGKGCLWCNGLIDATQLAMECKSDEERKTQNYGVLEPNPSVITLNAVAAAHGVNEFLFDYLSVRPPRADLEYLHLVSAGGNMPSRAQPRKDKACRECSTTVGSRFAMGDARQLPTMS